MSRYRKIEVRTWSDERFRSLSALPPCAQGLWFFLLTGPHTGPIPGLFRAGRAGMAEELGWEQKAFDEAFDEVLSKGMAKADFNARLVWLPNAIKHNRPESPNVIRSWRSEFDLLPECALKAEAFDAMRLAAQAMGEAFIKAFQESLCKPENDAPPSRKASAKPSRKASAKTKPNQEQEQEQEQKKDIAQHAARFEEFWLAYPVKKGRAAALATWQRRKLDGQADRIIADVKARIATDRQWLDGFAPHGSTYVNQSGWEDAIEPVRPKLAAVGGSGYQPLPGEF